MYPLDTDSGLDLDLVSEDDYEAGDFAIDPDLPGADISVRDSADDISDDEDDFDQFPEFSSDEDPEFANEDSDLDENDFNLRENIKAASGFKIKKRAPKSALYGRRQAMRAANRELDPEVRDHLAKANAAFVADDLETAYQEYQEVVKLDNKNFNAYKTLGEICMMLGQQNRACSYWIIAAEIHSWDGNFWHLVGELSERLGHIDQAIYCYQKSIKTSQGSILESSLLHRSLLYRQKGQYGRALDGFQRLHQLNPRDFTYIHHLADVYIDQKRYNDAVSLYEKVLESNIRDKQKASKDLEYGEKTKNFPPFRWYELELLCNLYSRLGAWRSGIAKIKTVARFIQNRENEGFWDEQDDDTEFSEHRQRVLMDRKPPGYRESLQKPHQLPPDIWYHLGKFRLEAGPKEEALLHFRRLKRRGPKDMADLNFQIGRELEAHGSFHEAIEFLSELNSADNRLETEELLGKCYLLDGQFELARDTLLKLFREGHKNTELQLILLEALYHTHDFELAQEVARLFGHENDNMDVEVSTSPYDEDYDAEDDDDASSNQEKALIRTRNVIRKTLRKRISDADRKETEKKETKRVVDKFDQLSRFHKAIENKLEGSLEAWLELANQLIAMFLEVKGLFPKSKKSAFKEMVMYKQRKHMGLEEKTNRIRRLWQGISESETSKIESFQIEYRGLTFDQWLSIFVQYAIYLRMANMKIEEASELIELALEIGVFTQDKTRSMVLRITRIALGISAEDFGEAVSNNVRYLITSAQFSPTIYNFFMCCFGSGVRAWAAFSNYNHQKHYLRQVKAFDSLLRSSKISGSAQITADLNGFIPTREHPHLLYLYACFLGSNRTFASPIVYLTRAYKQYSKEPTICFMLGLAHVHRSMQRNSSNRHIQLLQGISYLMEYRAARLVNATIYEKQEIEYNYGRLFHMLGLTTLAVKHYDRVLESHPLFKDDPDYDLLTDAAYNLVLIYSNNGNTLLSKQLIDEYLVI